MSDPGSHQPVEGSDAPQSEAKQVKKAAHLIKLGARLRLAHYPAPSRQSGCSPFSAKSMANPRAATGNVIQDQIEQDGTTFLLKTTCRF